MQEPQSVRSGHIKVGSAKRIVDILDVGLIVSHSSQFKSTSEYNDTTNNKHVKIETPGYGRVRFMVKCCDKYPPCLLEIGSMNEHAIHSWTSESNIEANDGDIEENPLNKYSKFYIEW